MAFDDHFRPPDGWEPVPRHEDTPATPALVRPAMPSTQPGPNPFLRTTLPASACLQPDLLRHSYNPMVPQSRLVPLQKAADPAYGAIAKSVILASAAPAELSSSDPFLKFRGVWQSFTPYKINDVVLFNGSAYVALTASVNAEPDANPPTQLDTSAFTTGSGTTTSALSTSVQPNQSGEFAVLCVANSKLASYSYTDPADGTWSRIAGVFPAWTKLDSSAALLSESQTLTNSGGGTIYWISDIALFGVSGGTPSVVQTASFGSNQNPGPGLSLNDPPAFTPTAGNTLFCELTISQPSLGFGTHPQNLSISDSAGNNWIVIGQPSNPGSGGGDFAQLFLAYATNVRGVSTQVTITQSPSDNNSAHFNGWSGGVYEITNLAVVVKSTTTWQLLSENFTFNVPASAQTYSPFDVIQFRGSMFVCLKPTSSDAFSDPSSWGLFAQGTGSVVSLSGNYTPAAADYGRLIQNDTASSFTVTLPTPPNNSWWIALQDSGTGTIVLSPGSLTLDGSSASITLHQGQGLLVFTDGTNYFTWRGFGTVTNVTGALTNNAVVLGNGGSDVKALGSLGTTTTVLHGNTGAPSYASVTENDFSLSDVTTDNVSTTQHGYAPKLPGDATKFLDGTGNYSAPSGIVLSDTSVSGTLVSQSVSGTLRPNGAVPPAGVYRVKVYMLMQANPNAGTLAVNIGWNDGTAARNAAPANISTAALNAAGGGTIITADGVHDITYAFNLT